MHGSEITRILKGGAPFTTEELKRLFELMMESRKETELTKREMKKYNSVKDVMIQEITGRYKFYEFFFSKVFAERSEALRKDFEIIDQGIKENNRELINAGVSGLSQVVSSSPFTDMDNLKKMIEN